MTATPPSSRDERLRHWLAELEHILPAQAPIRDFVHHNTLHGFQHLPFAEALAAAQALTGAGSYWPLARFREAFASGRIGRDDLLGALADAGIDDLEAPVWGGLCRRDVWLAALLVDETAPPDATRLAACRQLLPAAPAGADWRELAARRWAALGAGVGRQYSLRGLLARLSGEDVLASVRGILQRHLAAHLDLGMAAWRNPAHGQGFYAAWKASAGRDLAWELDELPDIRDEIQHLPDDAVVLLEAELRELQPDEAGWYEILQRLALEMPGWSGMFLRRDRHPLADAGTPVAMADYLAVRVFLERRLCGELLRRLTGSPGGLAELDAYCRVHPAEFLVRDARHLGCLPEDLLAAAGRLCAAPAAAMVANAVANAAAWEAAWEEAWEADWEALAPAVAAHLADDRAAADARALAGLLEQLAEAAPTVLDEAGARALLGELARLTPELRGQLWLEAYEGHYREQLFGALAANAGRRHAVATPSAQVVMCMDDREEGTRRHLEEIAPDIETFGAAGFFGLPMYWQGLDDAQPIALCPVVVTPDRLVREQPVAGSEAACASHARRRELRLRWRERLYQDTRRAPLAGPLLTAAAGLPALAALTVTTLAPAWLARALRRWREQFDGRVAGEPALTRAARDDPGRLPVFSDEEQVERVEDFLRTIGLTDGFAPLVLMFGHASGSRNNPHLSAYDCGACSGRHGGPNARVFAAMANRPEVRAGLAGRGIVIPPDCHFVAAEHHTGDDSIEWYDLDRLPAARQPDFDRLLAKLAEACRWHAVERCRRLASAPPRPNPWQAMRHVAGRVADPAQARPELGHATNAAAFIGRRAMSRGLFLDRRVFLISYDPEADGDGAIVERILLAAGPVGAGIALEYYFSTVDNEAWGCGSKVTHNLTGLFGVMEGAESDLRTGLPWQMVEIHEPMRLLVVVEQKPEVLSAIVARQPALQELVGNAWINLAARDPASGALHRYCPRRGWLPWAGSRVLPQVARSHDWFAGESGPLAPAMLLGGVT